MAKAETVSWPEWGKWVNEQLADFKREIARLKNELTLLKTKVEPLYAVHLAPRILQVLREEGRPRSWRWIWKRFGCDAWEALKHLEAEGMVVVTKAGHHTMYAAKET